MERTLGVCEQVGRLVFSRPAPPEPLSVEDTPKRPPGRPKGTFRSLYEKPRGFRLTAKDLERLAGLSQRWELSESEVVRQLIRQAASQEGIE